MIRFILFISCYFLSLFVDCYKLPFLDSLMKFRGVLPRFFCDIAASMLLECYHVYPWVSGNLVLK